jgi:ArsR family transcriptional regulator, arsenate/arsenite/antimonite-responsive transcriptional repressor
VIFWAREKSSILFRSSSRARRNANFRRRSAPSVSAGFSIDQWICSRASVHVGQVSRARSQRVMTKWKRCHLRADGDEYSAVQEASAACWPAGRAVSVVPATERGPGDGSTLRVVRDRDREARDLRFQPAVLTAVDSAPTLSRPMSNPRHHLDVAAPEPAEGGCCPPKQKLPPRDTKSYAKLCKALGDETRIEILRLLAACGAELCVCDIESHFDLSQPTVSHHLKVLRDACLVRWERRGTWVYYALDREKLRLISELYALFYD